MILKSLLIASLWILSALAQQQTEADCVFGLDEWNENMQKCVPSCTEGKKFNEDSGLCEDSVPDQCTPGLEEWNSELGRCTTICEQGLKYNIDTEKCEDDNEIRSSCPRKCGEGETLDEFECRCIKQLGDCCKASASDYDIRLVSAPNCNCEKKCEDLGPEYKCVTNHICSNGEIITDGGGILTTYSAESTIDLANVACPDHLTCCKNVGPRNGNLTTETPPTRPPVDLNQCGRIATGGPKFVDSSNPGDALEEYTAQIGEFPHMCIFYSQTQGSQAYRGGASLIGTKFLLTAAHKLHYVKNDKTHDIREESLSARCGVLNAKRMEPNFPDPQDRMVSKLLIHPEFDPSLLTHNIAILYVRDPFTLVDHISPVCLPKPNTDYTGSTDCYSTGFGADSYDRPEYSDLLKKVKLPVVDSQQCQETIQALPRFNEKKFIVHDNWICVGGEGEEDTCRGDGGGPHVCKHNNQWVQVGAVAFGFGCGREGIPSVYSAVAPEMCWIDWVMSCQENLPESVSNVVDQRTTGEQMTVESVNGISRRDCSQWLNDRPDLLQQCKVNYL